MAGDHGTEGYALAMNQEAGPGPATAAPRGTGRPPRKQFARPSLGGGTPAQDRELRAQGRETVRKLLEAGMVEFEDRGFHGVRVDDVVRRAGISHGTFYLYFSNKEDLFKALLKDALHDMEIVAGDFPIVTQFNPGDTLGWGQSLLEGVLLINDYPHAFKGLKVEIKVVGPKEKVIYKDVRVCDVEADCIGKPFETNQRFAHIKGFAIPKNAKPGEYQVRVAVADRKGKKIAHNESSFQVVRKKA